MRIDKFLWHSRIYKSRTIAGNACKKGHVKMNLKSLKPSSEVYPNMTISVKKNQILNQYEIKNLPKSRIGAKIVDLYINNITPKSELEKKLVKAKKVRSQILKLKQDINQPDFGRSI